MKRLILLIGLWALCYGFMYAGTDDIAKNTLVQREILDKDLNLGINLGLGSSFISDYSKWQAQGSTPVGIFAQGEIRPNLDLRIEVQRVTINTERKYEHPYPYVFEMTAKVKTQRVRVPFSFLVSTGYNSKNLRAYLGAGSYIDYVYDSEYVRVLQYLQDSQVQKASMEDQFATPVLGVHGLVGLYGKKSFVELRYNRDISTFEVWDLNTNQIGFSSVYFMIGLRLGGIDM